LFFDIRIERRKNIMNNNQPNKEAGGGVKKRTGSILMRYITAVVFVLIAALPTANVLSSGSVFGLYSLLYVLPYLIIALGLFIRLRLIAAIGAGVGAAANIYFIIDPIMAGWFEMSTLLPYALTILYFLFLIPASIKISRTKIIFAVPASLTAVALLIVDYMTWGDFQLFNVALYLLMALGAFGLGFVDGKKKGR
jgi:hypothetical protein